MDINKVLDSARLARAVLGVAKKEEEFFAAFPGVKEVLLDGMERSTIRSQKMRIAVAPSPDHSRKRW